MVHILASDKPVRGEVKYERKKGWFSKEVVREKVEAYPTEIAHCKLHVLSYTNALRDVIRDTFGHVAEKVGIYKNELYHKFFGINQAVLRSPIGDWDRGPHPVAEKREDAEKYALTYQLTLYALAVKQMEHLKSITPEDKKLAEAYALALEKFAKDHIKITRHDVEWIDDPNKIYDGFVVPPPEDIFKTRRTLTG